MNPNFDLFAEFRNLLLAKSGVAALVGTRVSCNELPEGFGEAGFDCAQSISMVLVPNPDEQMEDYPPLAAYQFAVACWGKSSLLAAQLARAVMAAFFDMGETTVGSVCWKYATASIAGFDRIEETGWCFYEVHVHLKVDVT